MSPDPSERKPTRSTPEQASGGQTKEGQTKEEAQQNVEQELATTSSDATYSTKTAVEPEDTYPPSGPAVEEERGLPSEGGTSSEG